jgi:hypothetical protein
LHLLGRHLLDPDVAPITWSSPILLKFWDMMDWVKTSCAGYLFSCVTSRPCHSPKKIEKILIQIQVFAEMWVSWAGLRDKRDRQNWFSVLSSALGSEWHAMSWYCTHAMRQITACDAIFNRHLELAGELCWNTVRGSAMTQLTSTPCSICRSRLSLAGLNLLLIFSMWGESSRSHWDHP